MKNSERTSHNGFIVFEGIDGCGKTTVARYTAEALQKNGFDAMYSSEFGDDATEYGKHLNQFDRTTLLPHAHALAILSARVQHTEEIIRPALKQGKVVLQDRYNYSTLCYQGAQSKLWQMYAPMRHWTIRPKHTILIDIPVEVALERRGKRAYRIDTKHLNKVRRRYLDLLEQTNSATTFHFIDGTKPIETVSYQVSQLVLEIVKQAAGGK